MRTHACRSSLSWILALPLLLAGPPSHGQCDAPISSDADTTLAQDGGVSGFDERLELRASPDQRRDLLLHFDLRALANRPLTLHQARLELTIAEFSGIKPWGFTIRSVDGSWSEGATDWHNAPPSPVQYGVARSTHTEGVISIDLTTLVRHWLAEERRHTSVRLIPESDADFRAKFLSREGAPADGGAPRLVLQCAEDIVSIPLDPTPGDAAQLAGLGLLSAGSSVTPSITLGDRGAVRSARFEVKIPPAHRGNPRAAAAWFLEAIRGLIRLGDPTHELQLIRESSDGSHSHLAYRQRHAGIPVEGAELIVHLTDLLITGIDASYAPELTVFTEPRLSASEAVALALAAQGDGALRFGDTQLRIFVPQLAQPSATGEPRLAWRVQAGVGPSQASLLIDASSGGLLQTDPAQRDAFDLSLSTVQGADITQQWQSNTCWANSSMDVEWFTESGAVSNPNPPIDAEGQAANTNINAVDAFWRSQLGRDSWNDSGGRIGVYVNGTDPRGANAFYSSACDQIDFHTGMATLDVVGHEYTHGIVSHEPSLVYARQSGALDEGYADLFGFFVDPADTEIGEGSALGALRNLADPDAGNQPDHMAANQSTDGVGFLDFLPTEACDGNNDFCGVHTNSGIVNKAHHLVVAGGTNHGFTIIGLGRAYAARLFYNVIRNRLTSSSDFRAARDAAMTEAAALSPNPSTSLTPYQRACQVRNAFASVGIGAGDPLCIGTVPDDLDLDGVPDSVDNCVAVQNSSQWDLDRDGVGNPCDADDDGDGVTDPLDNCPFTQSPNTQDVDQDGFGDPCDDSDADGVMDDRDNCRLQRNPTQLDSEGDGAGNVCDPDDDNDTVPDGPDNCQVVSNPLQEDRDGDTVGDACDLCADQPDTGMDTDGDHLDDACDPDDDEDMVPDGQDNCPLRPNPQQGDLDQDGTGDACDPDWPGNVFLDRYFWNVPRPMHWERIDLPLEAPVQICPWCPEGPLPKQFQTVLDVHFDRAVGVSILDGLGRTVATSPDLATDHRLVLRPTPYASTRFDLERGRFDEGVPAAGAPGYLAPDQTRYTMLIHAGPEIVAGGDYALSLTQHTCDDLDGDGFGSPGSIACPAGDAEDCDDTRRDVHPSAIERCDNLDNDCNGGIDGFTTTCGAGVCQRNGTCFAGIDSCAAGSGSGETCNGLDDDCSGAVDDGLTPAPAPVLTFESHDVLTWTAPANATAYDVVIGDLAGLVGSDGNFSTSILGCRAHGTLDTGLFDNLVPAAGAANYYLVRALGCTGAASYDDPSPGLIRSRDASILASPLTCGDCPHDTCVLGGALRTSCGSCAGSICAVDPYCCSAFWDGLCIAEVRSVCQSARCDESRGACGHTLCSAGAPLAAGCDAPSWGTSCVSTVCAADPFCCNQSWDADCAQEVETVCGRSCD